MQFLILIIAVFIAYVILAFKKPGIAIITSPIASFACAMIVFSEWIYTDEFQVVAITLSLLIVPVTLTVIRFLLPHDDSGNRWPRIVSVWIFRMTGYLFSLVLLTAFFNIFGVGMWILFTVFICRYYTTHCRAIEMDVISTIGACMRQNLPLAMAMETAAASYPPRHARITGLSAVSGIHNIHGHSRRIPGPVTRGHTKYRSRDRRKSR